MHLYDEPLDQLSARHGVLWDFDWLSVVSFLCYDDFGFPDIFILFNFRYELVILDILTRTKGEGNILATQKKGQ